MSSLNETLPGDDVVDDDGVHGGGVQQYGVFCGTDDDGDEGVTGDCVVSAVTKVLLLPMSGSTILSFCISAIEGIMAGGTVIYILWDSSPFSFAFLRKWSRAF